MQQEQMQVSRKRKHIFLYLNKYKTISRIITEIDNEYMCSMLTISIIEFRVSVRRERGNGTTVSRVGRWKRRDGD